MHPLWAVTVCYCIHCACNGRYVTGRLLRDHRLNQPTMDSTDALTLEGVAILLSRLMGIEDRRETLVGTIALSVAKDLIEGRIKPGQDLNSIDLSKRFKSSRTPIREALLALENEGLV